MEGFEIKLFLPCTQVLKIFSCCLCVFFCYVVHVYLLLTEVWASIPLS